MTETERPARAGAAARTTATDGADAHGPTMPTALADALGRIESSAGLDRPGEVLGSAARAVAPPGPIRDALTGTWLGHALHPLMTDIPIGSWTSASILDLVGGRAARPAATRLVAVGVVSALPTAATGLAEWLQADRGSQRIGVVHANSNVVGLGLYTASLLARRRGRHGRGVVLALAGAAATTVGGYLGGHLTVARKVGTRDERFAHHHPG